MNIFLYLVQPYFSVSTYVMLKILIKTKILIFFLYEPLC